MATLYMQALCRSGLVEIDFEQRGEGEQAGLAVLRMTDQGMELELLRSKARQEKPVIIAVDRYTTRRDSEKCWRH